MISPAHIVSALVVATEMGKAKWLIDDMVDGVVCILPSEILIITYKRAPDNDHNIESLELLARGIKLLYLPESDSGKVLLALASGAEANRAELSRAKKAILSHFENILHAQ